MNSPKQEKFALERLQFNVAILFEGLCTVLTRAVVDRNVDLSRKVKQVIVRGIYRQPALKEELEIIRLMAKNGFKDKEVTSAFMQELLKQVKHTQQDINEGLKKLQVELRKSNLDKVVLESIKPSAPTTQRYAQIDRLISIRRQPKRNLQEVKEYHKILETLVESNSIEQPKPRILENRIGKKIPPIVYKKAVQIFQERYVSKLSPAIQELIQDYLYYQKTDRFLHAIAKRLKTTLTETKHLAQRAELKNLSKLVENMEACHSDLLQLSKNPTNTTDEHLFNMVKEVAHFIDMSEELRRLA